jgi:hypothetical protein
MCDHVELPCSSHSAAIAVITAGYPAMWTYVLFWTSARALARIYLLDQWMCGHYQLTYTHNASFNEAFIANLLIATLLTADAESPVLIDTF